MKIEYPVLVPRKGGCLARQTKNMSLQCIRPATVGDLCGCCARRKVKPSLVTNVFIPPVKVKAKVKRKTTFIKPQYLLDCPNHRISVKSLQLTLKKLNISYKSTDRKPKLLAKLEDYYKLLFPYLDKINKINSIIRQYRKYRQNYNVRLRGPGYKNPSICVNETDFYTCDNLAELDKLYLFTYANNGVVYGFDIRSFKELLEFSTNNPYDKSKIPETVIAKYKKLYDLCGSSLEEIPKDVLTKEQMVDQEIMKVFQILDELNYYTDTDWFKNLDRNKLIVFYVEVEDIWNYRAGLSATAQMDIVPDRNPFPLVKNRKPRGLIKSAGKRRPTREIRTECLQGIHKMITSGKTKADRILGALYVMSALVMVSKGAYKAYPHLWNPSPLCPYHP